MTKQKLQYRFLPAMMVGLGALFYCYEYFLRITPSVMKTDLMLAFGISAAAFGNLAAFYYYAYAPMQLIVGVLMDKIGPRRLLTIACLLCAGGSFLFADVHSLLIVQLGRFLVGLGSAFAFVGVLKLATIWLPAERFALVSGLTSALGVAGAILGDILLSDYVHTIGWRVTIYYSALMGVVLATILYFFLRDNGDASVAVQAETNNPPHILRDLMIILKNRMIWINGLIGCLLYLPTTAFAELWGIPYLESTRHFTAHEASIAVSVVFAGWGMSAPFVGWLSDKLKRRCAPMLVGGSLAFILSCILLYVPGLSTISVFVVLFLLGVSYSVQVIVFAFAVESSPVRAAGTAIAVTNMLVMIGGSIFQPVIGYLLDWAWSGNFVKGIPYYTTGDYRFAMSVMPLALLMGAILTFFLQETYCKRQDL